MTAKLTATLVAIAAAAWTPPPSRLKPAPTREYSAQDTRPPGDAPEKPASGFHHVHLNSVDPAAAIDFYTRTFAVTRKMRMAGLDAKDRRKADPVDDKDRRRADPVDGVSSEKIFLLFNKVSQPPATEPHTAVWHFGWGSPDMSGDVEKHRAAGVTFATPLSKLASGTEFAYMRGPDGALVEINTSTTRAFIHVHLYSENPLCAADWYVEHLGGARRGQPRQGPCEVPYGQPSEPLGVIRSPAATVRFGDVNLIIYPRQREGPLVPTRGHVVDHIALSVPQFAATLGRLQRAGVKVLRATSTFGNSRAVMIEGPDAIAIELVEVR